MRFIRVILAFLLLMAAIVPVEVGAVSGQRVNFITAGQESTTPASLGSTVAVAIIGPNVNVWVEMSAGSDTFELVCWKPIRGAWISLEDFTGDTTYFNDAQQWKFTIDDSSCTHYAIFRRTSTGTVTTTGGNPRAYIEVDVWR